MKLKYAFKRTITNSSASARQETKPEVPDGMLKKCNACKGAVFVDEVKKNNYICPHCGNYFRIHARRRIEMIADEGTFEEWDSVMPISNPLSYKGYPDKVKKLQEKTGLDEAIVTGRAKIGGVSAVLGVCDSRFLMASMGENVGEKIVRASGKSYGRKASCGAVCLLRRGENAGGNRILNADGQDLCGLKKTQRCRASLHQCSDQSNHRRVTASFAMLGDIILAEPGALIGFAGPRVIEQTIRQKLPKGFQKSEFLLEHGFIDQIVERKNMKETLAQLLKMHCENAADNRDEKAEQANKESYSPAKKSAWEHVLPCPQ